MKKLLLIIMIFLMLFSVLEGKKLQDYSAIGSGIAVDADLLRIEDMSASAGSRTKKILLSSMISYIFGTNRTMSGTFSMGANEISGSNIAFTGGDISGLTTLDADLLDVDNIRTNGNIISSTDVNGDITINPNGTGDINLTTSGGLVVITEGDLKIGATTITATGAELNLNDAGSAEAIYAGTNLVNIKADSAIQLVINNGRLEPAVDNDIDLGKVGSEFKDGYFDGVIYTDKIRLDGSSTLATMNYAVDTGVVENNYVVILDPAPTVIIAGVMLIFNPVTANTGACTINVNSSGAFPVKIDTAGAIADPASGDLDTDMFYLLIFDGTNWQLKNPS